MIYEVLTSPIGLIENKLPSSKITWLREKAQNFHKEQVDPYTPSMSMKEFNNFRRSYLNKIQVVKFHFNISQEYSDIFYNDKLSQILINLLQTCFIIRDELDIENYEDNYFDHFFLAASMLVVKVKS
jgi:hypothetical protein